MRVKALAVPYDSGIRGWRMGAGPERLLDAGLAADLRSAGHDVAVDVLALDTRERLSDVQTSFRLLALLAERVAAAVAADRFPLVLAGNCLTAVGTLAGMRGGSDEVVCWFDAHGDLNTPSTTASGFLDGMALAAAQGRCWEQLTRAIPGFTPVTARRTCLVGVRDLDPPEAALIAQVGITHVRPSAVAPGLRAFLNELRPARPDSYVHCDLDVLDPAVCRVNPFPASGGLTLDDVTSAIAAIGEGARVRAAAITAYAPEYDTDSAVPPAAFAIARALVSAAAARAPTEHTAE